MKRKIIAVLSAVLVLVLMTSLVACNKGDDVAPVAEPTKYKVQYTVDDEVKNVEVEDGVLFALEVPANKVGYDFLGYFDSATDGAQYALPTGNAVSEYSDKKNITLYPQFSPKSYVVILNYGEAEVSGEREFDVVYDTKLPELPKNLTVENKNFAGWFTEEDKGGVKVADKYGLVPMVSTINDTNFDIQNDTEYLNLYAGFEYPKHTVTFYDDNGNSEEMLIEYNTPIGEVASDLRKNGMAVLTWSKTQDGAEIFTGKITDDTVLYAQEWAPVIDFDSNGGEDVTSIIAESGQGIDLPKCEKENYTFAGWYTAGNLKYTSITMPSDSIALTAKWNAIISFDTRGGTDVENISKEKGLAVTLPTTEKEDFIFAGWYTDGGEKYATSSMPSESIKLKAMWHEVIKETIVVIAENESLVSDDHISSNKRSVVDLSSIYAGKERNIQITGHYQAKHDNAINGQEHYIKFYNSSDVSSANLLFETECAIDSFYKSYSFETSINLDFDDLFIYYISTESYEFYNWSYGRISDFYLEIEYPDTSKLV